MPDETLSCGDCHKEFVFTERERKFYADQVDRTTGGPWGKPKRCAVCRQAKKQARRSQGN
jgi:hypothetical protein